MPRLARPVVVYDDQNRATSFLPGDEPPAWAAGQISNPLAWDTHPLNRLQAAGATVEEISAFEIAWNTLTDTERAEAIDDDVDEGELREQLVEIRRLAREHGISIAEAVTQAISAGDIASGEHSDESDLAEPQDTLAKPLEQMNKDELVDEARRRGVDPSGRKDELLTRLQQES